MQQTFRRHGGRNAQPGQGNRGAKSNHVAAPKKIRRERIPVLCPRRRTGSARQRSACPPRRECQSRARPFSNRCISLGMPVLRRASNIATRFATGTWVSSIFWHIKVGGTALEIWCSGARLDLLRRGSWVRCCGPHHDARIYKSGEIGPAIQGIAIVHRIIDFGAESARRHGRRQMAAGRKSPSPPTAPDRWRTAPRGCGSGAWPAGHPATVTSGLLAQPSRGRR